MFAAIDTFTVMQCKKKSFEKYKLTAEMYCGNVLSFDGFRYKCQACDKTFREQEIPCQSIFNKLPRDLRNVRRLERVLISRRILFKKIAFMPKGQSPKLKGAFCNIPIKMINVSDVFSRQADNNGIVLVKLKRKLEYRGHVYFVGVRPEFILIILQYLKLNNLLYKNVIINVENIPDELINFYIRFSFYKKPK